jgi:hypothetical protein
MTPCRQDMAAAFVSARQAETGFGELRGHLRRDRLKRRRRPDHHLQLGDQSVLVEGQLVDSLDLLAVHLRGELEDRDAVVRILELVQVAELASGHEHLLRRPQHLQHLIAPFVRLEDDRAAERRVLVEQLRGAVDIASFDGSAETVGKHSDVEVRRQLLVTRIGRGESIPYVAGRGEDGALEAIRQVAELIDRVALRIEKAITTEFGANSRQKNDSESTRGAQNQAAA